MIDKKQNEQDEREETITDLAPPEGEAEMVKGGGRANVQDLPITKLVDKSTPR